MERFFTFAEVKSDCELPLILSGNFCKLEIRRLGYSCESRALNVLGETEHNVLLGGYCWEIRLWRPSITVQSHMIPHSDSNVYDGEHFVIYITLTAALLGIKDKGHLTKESE